MFNNDNLLSGGNNNERSTSIDTTFLDNSSMVRFSLFPFLLFLFILFGGDDNDVSGIENNVGTDVNFNVNNDTADSIS